MNQARPLRQRWRVLFKSILRIVELVRLCIKPILFNFLYLVPDPLTTQILKLHVLSSGSRLESYAHPFQNIVYMQRHLLRCRLVLNGIHSKFGSHFNLERLIQLIRVAFKPFPVHLSALECSDHIPKEYILHLYAILLCSLCKPRPRWSYSDLEDVSSGPIVARYHTNLY